MEVVDYNKYESYIRVGHTATETSDHVYSCSDLENFPTPTTLTTTLSDLDKDAYTDLDGYTHRNRIRSEIVSTLEISYDILSDNDIAYILKRIKPSWIYIELINKRTKEREVHKMYASDKSFDTFKVWKDEDGNWHEIKSAFSVQFTEE